MQIGEGGLQLLNGSAVVHPCVLTQRLSELKQNFFIHNAAEQRLQYQLERRLALESVTEPSCNRGVIRLDEFRFVPTALE